MTVPENWNHIYSFDSFDIASVYVVNDILYRVEKDQVCVVDLLDYNIIQTFEKAEIYYYISDRASCLIIKIGGSTFMYKDGHLVPIDLSDIRGKYILTCSPGRCRCYKGSKTCQDSVVRRGKYIIVNSRDVYKKPS